MRISVLGQNEVETRRPQAEGGAGMIDVQLTDESEAHCLKIIFRAKDVDIHGKGAAA
jgi:hypothetical protein